MPFTLRMWSNLFALEVAAVPRYEEVAAVVGSEGEVQSIAERIPWHQAMRKVPLDGFSDRTVDREQAQAAQEGEAVLLARVTAAAQLIENRFAGNQFIAVMRARPPLIRPLAARDHVRFRSDFVEKARDRCLDVDSSPHGSLLRNVVSSAILRGICANRDSLHPRDVAMSIPTQIT